MGSWKEYLSFLEGRLYSVGRLSSDLAPQTPILKPQGTRVRPSYELWPFQRKVLDRIAGDTLILGLPTGMGKTYIAGMYLKLMSEEEPARVLFLTPTVPLGVQQTLFARRMLNIKEACFISGQLSPALRRELDIWNLPFAVATPQVFANDVLSPFSYTIREARASGEAVAYIRSAFKEAGFSFPFNIVVADECQGYVGETDGYSTLLAAKASGARILALSATPQLHSAVRLEELKRVFDRIHVFSIEDPDIKRYMPERTLVVVRVFAPEGLLKVYWALGGVIREYSKRIAEELGADHAWDCREHALCVIHKALRLMRLRLVEDGASSVVRYGAWRIAELRSPMEELDGRSAYEVYRGVLEETHNHKISSALAILGEVSFEKAIVFLEPVEAAKQLGGILQRRHGTENVAVLVGKGSMSMEQQASALLHFREQAKVLVATSVGEEGLDIPSADIEVWLDPPSNPKKWIQRFGRILHQPGGRKRAVVYALVTMRTHERRKLLSVMKRTEEVYGFTQRAEVRLHPHVLPRGQATLTWFI